MANALGKLTPDIVTLQVIDMLMKQFPIFSKMATDFSAEEVNWNSTVTSRVVVPPAVQNFDPTVGYGGATPATTLDIPVTINKHPFVTLSFNEHEISGTNRKLATEQMRGAAYALGRQALADLFANVTIANFVTARNANASHIAQVAAGLTIDSATTVATVANTDRSTLGLIRKQMSKQGAGWPRVGLVNCDVFANLTDDQRIISRDYETDDVNYVGMGEITGVQGFESIFEWADLPANGGDNISGYFASTAGLVIATRVPKDPASAGLDGVPIPGVIKVITDPATGLSMMVRYWYDMGKATLNMTITWMYGTAIGEPGHAALLVTA